MQYDVNREETNNSQKSLGIEPSKPTNTHGILYILAVQ